MCQTSKEKKLFYKTPFDYLFKKNRPIFLLYDLHIGA